MNATRSFTSRRATKMRAAALALVLAAASALGGAAVSASGSAGHAGYAPGGGSARSSMLIH